MQAEHPPLLAPLRDALHRFVVTGLGAAPGRRDLKAHAARLRTQAGHLPQAARLADAVDRCAELPAPEAGVQLLKLWVAMHQLGSEMQLPPAAPVDPLPLAATPEGAVSTPLAPELLLELRTALSRRTQPPGSTLTLMADPRVVEDVRTWPLLLEGLAHPQLRRAAVEALRRIAPRLAPELQRRFNRRGDSTDAARLEVLIAANGRGLTPRLLESARRGSAPVRRVALKALAGHAGLAEDAREAVVLEVFDAAPEAERPGLADALCSLGTDAALRRLWQLAASGALDESRLRALLPPGRLVRWLSLVDEAVPGFAQTAGFFQLLEGWDAPEVRGHLMDRVRADDVQLRRLAAEALLPAADSQALRTLADRCLADPDLLDVGVTALHQLDAARMSEAVGPRVVAWLRQHADAAPLAPLPRWLQLIHHLVGADGAPAPDWWPKLDALMDLQRPREGGPPAPLQPDAIRERKER